MAAAILNQTPIDWNGNFERICEAIQQAKNAHVSILCLPEMCIPGYGCEDAFHSPGLQSLAMNMLKEIVTQTSGMIVSVGVPVLFQHGLFNTACLIADQKILGFTAKRFLAGDGIHYEPRWFKPWPAGEVAQLQLGERTYPLGDVLFDCGGIRIGFEICEDAWVAHRPGIDLASRGVDIILNPSASHFAFGKSEVRRRFVLEGSRAFSVHYVYSNLLGNEAGRAIYDGGALIASAGRMVAVGPRFSFRDVHLTTAAVDIDATRMLQSRVGSFRPDLAEGGSCVSVPFEFPHVDPDVQSISTAAWESGSHVKEEEFTRAVCLALFDYLRKSKSQGFVVSLSGGADSTTVACLCAMLVQLAEDELGLQGLKQKLAHLRYLDQVANRADLVKSLLACVYQATKNSSQTTQSAARQVAHAIGADYLEFDVQGQVDAYIQMVSRAIGRELDWKHDDLALQNIQARVRAPGIWLLANLRSALLLATSNRSEAAVGYATMDGDTAGGLSPIAGIDKAYLRNWLKWLGESGPQGIGAIRAVNAVNVLPPTAELRPAASKQTDEDDLMPYELLDEVERAAIRDKLIPLEVFLRIRPLFPQYEKSKLGTWIERFFVLWCRNQWKRERYAPSFHLDDENLDPKTWCRFPILSGNFQRELAELREYLACHE